MNLPTLEQKESAYQKYQEYKKAVKQNHSAQDKFLKQAYYYAKGGKKLINLLEVMKKAGVNSKGQPNLAICPADAEECFCIRWNDGKARFGRNRWSNHREKSIHLPSNTFDFSKGVGDLKAIVPSIPPLLRPKNLKNNYFILWEAEWETVPKDPILLKRISGMLFVVLATWDLTEIERTILI